MRPLIHPMLALLAAAAALASGLSAGAAQAPPAARPQLVLQVGHNALIREAAFSPDGAMVATGGDDGAVKLWNARTGELQRSLGPMPGHFYAVTFSPDGRTLATGGTSGRVELWDIASGTKRRALEPERGWIFSLAFSPDGSLLAAGSHQDEGRVRVWETATGKLRHTFEGHRDYMVHSVAFSPDGKLVASGGADRTVRLWDLATGAAVRSLDAGLPVTSLAFSPDGKRLASGGGQGILLWRVEGGQPEHRLSAGAVGMNALRFSADGMVLSAAGTDGLTRWEVRTGQAAGKPLQWFNGFAAAVAPDGQSVAVSHYGGGLSFMAPGLVRKVPSHSGWIFAARFSPDGSLLATGSNDRMVRVWEARTGRLRWAQRDAGSVHALAFSPDGKLLASGSGWVDPAHPLGFVRPTLGGVRLRKADTGEAVHTLEGHIGGVQDVVFSRDGKTLASASADTVRRSAEVRLWDPATGTPGRVVSVSQSEVALIRISPGLQSFVIGRENGAAEARDLASNQVRRTGSVRDRANDLVFSPDGKRWAATHYEYALTYWNAETAEILREFEEPGRQVEGTVFSPDGQTLATGARDPRVTLRNPETGKLLATLTVPLMAVRAPAFSPDGKTLALAGAANTVTLWDLPRRRLLATLAVPPAEQPGGASGEWLTFTPEGYYEASPGAAAFIRWRVGGQLAPAERFEKELRQPERLREALVVR